MTSNLQYIDKLELVINITEDRVSVQGYSNDYSHQSDEYNLVRAISLIWKSKVDSVLKDSPKICKIIQQLSYALEVIKDVKVRTIDLKMKFNNIDILTSSKFFKLSFIDLSIFSKVKYNELNLLIDGLQTTTSDNWRDYLKSNNITIEEDEEEQYNKAVKNCHFDNRVYLNFFLFSSKEAIKINELNIKNCRFSYRDFGTHKNIHANKTVFDNCDLYNIKYGSRSGLALCHNTKELIIKNNIFYTHPEDKEGDISEYLMNLIFKTQDYNSDECMKILEADLTIEQRDSKIEEINRRNFFKIVVENCTFNVDVYQMFYKTADYLLHDVKFKHCIFNKSFTLEGCQFENFVIQDCTFNSKLFISRTVYDVFIVMDTGFKQDVSFSQVDFFSGYMCLNVSFTQNCSFVNAYFCKDIVLCNSVFSNALNFITPVFGRLVNISTSSFNTVIIRNTYFTEHNLEREGLFFDYSLVYSIENYKKYFSNLIKHLSNQGYDYIYNTCFVKAEHSLAQRMVNIDLCSMRGIKDSMVIFKNSLDKTQSHIEANIFYALEMIFYKKYLTNLLKDSNLRMARNIAKYLNVKIGSALRYYKSIKNKIFPKKKEKYRGFHNKFYIKEKYFTAITFPFNVLKNISTVTEVCLFSLNETISKNYQSPLRAILWYIFFIPLIAILIKYGDFLGFQNATTVDECVTNVAISFKNKWSNIKELWSNIVFPFNYSKGEQSIFINTFRVLETYTLWQIVRSSMRNFKR